jgi:hypothetical protein
VSTCAWCSKEIPEHTEVFSVGAKAKPEIDLSEEEGSIILLPLDVTGKTVPAMIVNSDSQAKKDGYDIVFMVCSEDCGRALREALEEEIESRPNG